MTSIPIALIILLAAAFLAASGISHSATTSSMNFLAAGPSRPPASTTNPCTAPLYFFLFTASPAFADTPGWRCVFCLATTDLVAGHTMATSLSHLRAFTSTFR